MSQFKTTKAATTRRNFLGLAAGAATVSIVAPRVLGGPRHVAPSDTVNVALVGAGGRGLQNCRELMQLPDVRVVAVADPAEHWDLSDFYYRGEAGRLPTCAEIDAHYQQQDSAPKCRQYEDFREMLPKEEGLDAVLCATPDHLHALVSLAAMRAGKHVYCEKPLTHNIAEARLVAQVAEETHLATQMGNQGHSSGGIRRSCELIWSGAIGEVSQVHAWVPATRWNPGLLSTPSDALPVPKGLNWDLWCGPRAVPAFHRAFAPVAWRDFWMFGCGALGDFGCHDLDSSVWALNLEAPTSVEMHPAGPTDDAMAPYGEMGYFRFPARDGMPPVQITWYSGGLLPQRPEQLPGGQQLPNRGVMFVGAKGVMICGGAGGDPAIYPEALRESVAQPDATIRRSNGHHRDWIDAIKGGPPASSNFQYGAKLTEITLLGLLALRTGQEIRWDSQAMQAVGVPEADPMIHEDYRAGWELQ